MKKLQAIPTELVRKLQVFSRGDNNHTPCFEHVNGVIPGETLESYRNSDRYNLLHPPGSREPPHSFISLDGTNLSTWNGWELSEDGNRRFAEQRELVLSCSLQQLSLKPGALVLVALSSSLFDFISSPAEDAQAVQSQHHRRQAVAEYGGIKQPHTMRTCSTAVDEISHGFNTSMFHSTEKLKFLELMDSDRKVQGFGGEVTTSTGTGTTTAVSPRGKEHIHLLSPKTQPTSLPDTEESIPEGDKENVVPPISITHAEFLFGKGEKLSSTGDVTSVTTSNSFINAKQYDIAVPCEHPRPELQNLFSEVVDSNKQGVPTYEDSDTVVGHSSCTVTIIPILAPHSGAVIQVQCIYSASREALTNEVGPLEFTETGTKSCNKGDARRSTIMSTAPSRFIHHLDDSGCSTVPHRWQEQDRMGSSSKISGPQHTGIRLQDVLFYGRVVNNTATSASAVEMKPEQLLFTSRTTREQAMQHHHLGSSPSNTGSTDGGHRLRTPAHELEVQGQFRTSFSEGWFSPHILLGADDSKARFPSADTAYQGQNITMSCDDQVQGFFPGDLPVSWLVTTAGTSSAESLMEILQRAESLRRQHPSPGEIINAELLRWPKITTVEDCIIGTRSAPQNVRRNTPTAVPSLPSPLPGPLQCKGSPSEMSSKWLQDLEARSWRFREDACNFDGAAAICNSMVNMPVGYPNNSLATPNWTGSNTRNSDKKAFVSTERTPQRNLLLRSYCMENLQKSAHRPSHQQEYHMLLQKSPLEDFVQAQHDANRVNNDTKLTLRRNSLRDGCSYAGTAVSDAFESMKPMDVQNHSRRTSMPVSMFESYDRQALKDKFCSAYHSDTLREAEGSTALRPSLPNITTRLENNQNGRGRATAPPPLTHSSKEEDEERAAAAVAVSTIASALSISPFPGNEPEEISEVEEKEPESEHSGFNNGELLLSKSLTDAITGTASLAGKETNRQAVNHFDNLHTAERSVNTVTESYSKSIQDMHSRWAQPLRDVTAEAELHALAALFMASSAVHEPVHEGQDVGKEEQQTVANVLDMDIYAQKLAGALTQMRDFLHLTAVESSTSSDGLRKSNGPLSNSSDVGATSKDSFVYKQMPLSSSGPLFPSNEAQPTLNEEQLAASKPAVPLLVCPDVDIIPRLPRSAFQDQCSENHGLSLSSNDVSNDVTRTVPRFVPPPLLSLDTISQSVSFEDYSFANTLLQNHAIRGGKEVKPSDYRGKDYPHITPLSGDLHGNNGRFDEGNNSNSHKSNSNRTSTVASISSLWNDCACSCSGNTTRRHYKANQEFEGSSSVMYHHGAFLSGREFRHSHQHNHERCYCCSCNCNSDVLSMNHTARSGVVGAAPTMGFGPNSMAVTVISDD